MVEIIFRREATGSIVSKQRISDDDFAFVERFAQQRQCSIEEAFVRVVELGLEEVERAVWRKGARAR